MHCWNNCRVREPQMSDDFMLRSLKRRQKEWLDEWAQLQRDVTHWNLAHPEEEPVVIEPITRAELESPE
jgi:hypothetical protein